MMRDYLEPIAREARQDVARLAALVWVASLTRAYGLGVTVQSSSLRARRVQRGLQVIAKR